LSDIRTLSRAVCRVDYQVAAIFWSPSESRKFPMLGTLVNRQRQSSAWTARNQSRRLQSITPTKFWFDDRFRRFRLASQINPLRVLSAFWLTAGKPTSLKMANTCEKGLSLAVGAAGPIYQSAIKISSYFHAASGAAGAPGCC
jgi:hypothetical protein